jgi:hypothetical protein
MQRWKKGLGLVVGLAIVAGACTGVERVSGPDGVRFSEQPAPAVPADSAVHVPQDGAQGDTTGGRWGGYIGAGG